MQPVSRNIEFLKNPIISSALHIERTHVCGFAGPLWEIVSTVLVTKGILKALLYLFFVLYSVSDFGKTK